MRLYLGGELIAECKPIELQVLNENVFSSMFQFYMRRGEDYYFRSKYGKIKASFSEKLDIKIGEFYRLKGTIV
jgi:hypothetical protein